MRAAPACGVFEAAGDYADIVTYASSTVGVNANLQTGVAIAGTAVDNLMLVAAGNSTFEYVYGSAQADNLTGDDQANVLRPSKGDDVVSGGANPAVAITPAGCLGTTASLCDVPGSARGDRVDYSDLSDGVTVDLVANTATGTSAGKDTFSGIEGVRGSSGDDTITDNATQNNYYRMDGGNDTLNQGGDCATVSDADIIDGGDGIDTISYSDRTSDLTVDLNVGPGGSPRPGNGDLSCAENDSFFNYLGTSPTVENAVLGTANDTFWGTLQNNTVWPNGGQNTLNGCGTGAVPDVGCAAGTNGIDTVKYDMGYANEGVTINLAGGGPTSGNQDSISGFTNAVGSGGPDNIIGTDTIAGTNGANALKGGKGNDTISANAGPDDVVGGAGADNIRLGSGDDSGKGSDGNDNIRGGNGDDNIKGGKGKDTCDGGGGSDVVKCEKKKGGKKAAAKIRAARLQHLVFMKP